MRSRGEIVGALVVGLALSAALGSLFPLAVAAIVYPWCARLEARDGA